MHFVCEIPIGKRAEVVKDGPARSQGRREFTPADRAGALIRTVDRFADLERRASARLATELLESDANGAKKMRTADIIDAVLEKDIPVLRAAFEHLISSLRTKAAATTHVDAVLLNEVCVALAQDEAAMERQLCGMLGLPATSTFRAAAAKIVAMRTPLVAGCVQLHS